MALSVAFTTQCSFCIDAHTKGAIKAGANDAEIAEAAWVAAALRAGGAFTHGRMALQISDSVNHEH